MIGRMMIGEFWQGKKSLLLKVAVPFAIVVGAGSAGYAGIGLAMLLLFTGLLGAGMSVVRLKTAGLYDRLIASPAGKTGLFLEVSGAQSLVLVIQYLPALAGAAWFAGLPILYPAVLSMLVVAVLGVAIGAASGGLGEMHQNAVLAVLPLLLATFAPHPAARVLPFHGIIAPELTAPAIVLPVITLVVLYLLFAAWASRL